MHRTAVKTTEDASAAIARAAARMSFDDLSPAVVDAAKRSILDTLGVAMGATGAASDDIAPVRELVKGWSTPAGVPALAFGWPLQTLDAVFWFGALAHCLDYDDLADVAVIHPSAAVVAAALPLAQAGRTIDGRSAIVAVALGQDLVVRIGLAGRRAISDYGWLHSLPSVFGAAIASAKLLELDEDAVRSTLGLALHQASGTMQAGAGAGSAYRAVRDGFVARAGALSAQLAWRGMPGDEDSLEGQFGLFPQFFGGDYDREVLLDGTGDELLGTTIGLKAWPCAGQTQLFLTALDELMTDPTVRREDVRRIAVIGSNELFRAQCEPRAARVAPGHSIDAKWSIPFLVGKFLCHGTVRVRDFLPAGLRDEEAIAIAERVECRLDPSLRGIREGFGPGVVELDLADGRTLRARADHAVGHPDKPLSWERIIAKFDECLAEAAVEVSPAARDEVVGAVTDLESVPDIRILADCLAQGAVG